MCNNDKTYSSLKCIINNNLLRHRIFREVQFIHSHLSTLKKEITDRAQAEEKSNNQFSSIFFKKRDRVVMRYKWVDIIKDIRLLTLFKCWEYVKTKFIFEQEEKYKRDFAEVRGFVIPDLKRIIKYASRDRRMDVIETIYTRYKSIHHEVTYYILHYASLYDIKNQRDYIITTHNNINERILDSVIQHYHSDCPHIDSEDEEYPFEESFSDLSFKQQDTFTTFRYDPDGHRWNIDENVELKDGITFENVEGYLRKALGNNNLAMTQQLFSHSLGLALNPSVILRTTIDNLAWMTLDVFKIAFIDGGLKTSLLGTKDNCLSILEECIKNKTNSNDTNQIFCLDKSLKRLLEKQISHFKSFEMLKFILDNNPDFKLDYSSYGYTQQDVFNLFVSHKRSRLLPQVVRYLESKGIISSIRDVDYNLLTVYLQPRLPVDSPDPVHIDLDFIIHLVECGHLPTEALYQQCIEHGNIMDVTRYLAFNGKCKLVVIKDMVTCTMSLVRPHILELVISVHGLDTIAPTIISKLKDRNQDIFNNNPNQPILNPASIDPFDLSLYYINSLLFKYNITIKK
ncbi:hypothetical protein DFA_00274 [Cavenderia fasciculata]|uniref:Uncharacterized protein n=1 Tax=Cavenderia fasciculata TaxID=261658 RepID=F4PY36_CACFS|nr:uncharacterized protein DFA_00274 [Cavenderia fasciculata]EGG19696.1 hypothetical protein DFA_00274 [Cavenderia fasciculata]|eukprot:XP_004357990.1 hypothetical protein DFA_00274 [Cavenderia fasciculata]